MKISFNTALLPKSEGMEEISFNAKLLPCFMTQTCASITNLL